MMPAVKIYGAGSIGNHLSHACRTLGWDVVVCDVSQEALDRMRDQIYPARYGAWDNRIKLCTNDRAPHGGFDYIFVGTPPEHHLPIALETLAEKPRAILVEKPACPPHMELAQSLKEAALAANIRVFVGYDHIVGQATQIAQEVIEAGRIGEVLALDVEFREHWEGIFNAHPWLNGPQDSYLGYWERGGGASGEHSHALNLWQHFARTFGKGRVVEVDATVTYITEGQARFDSMTAWNLRTDTGFQGRVVQDVITRPHRKAAHIQGTLGRVEWAANASPEGDVVTLCRPKEADVVQLARKQRRDDFIAEVRHLQRSVEDKAPSPLDLQHGLDTALVVAAAHRSEAMKRRMKIDWCSGYTQGAIVPCS